MSDSTTLSIGCYFPTLEYYTCATEFPVIPDIFKDSISNENEDEIYFEYIGGIIDNPCNPVIITASKVSNSPATCQDSFQVFLEYVIDDGESIQRCTRTLITMRPPLQVRTPARDMTYSCDQNIDSLFNDWIENFGYSESMICYGNLSGFTTPADPELNFSCDGTGSIKVKFNLRDGCGNKDTTTAQFFVIDTIPPDLTCPPDMTFNISSISLFSDIDTLLQCASAFDICSDPVCLNDFTEDKVLYNCDSLQIIPVEYIASDNCGNTSQCMSVITIENVDGPMIQCPSNITIDCGNTDNDSLINHWLTTASALDFYGEASSISINYDNNIHINNYCDTIFEVNFTAHDICARSQSCAGFIHTRDIQIPVIDSCPQPVVFNQNDSTLYNKVFTWISLFEAHDSCSTVNFENDFNQAFLEYNCDSIRARDVTFSVLDECGNSNSCTSRIEILNDLQGELSCPQPLTILCGEEENENIIIDWINEAQAYDNHTGVYSINSQLDMLPLLAYGCYVEQVVQFDFTDRCGNIHQCQSMITLQDNTPPVITCPSDSIFAGDFEDFESEISNWLIQTTAIDDCREPFVYSNFNTADLLNCDEEYDIPITVYARDSCSLISQCQVTAFIQTDKSPVINCPASITIHCGDISNDMIIDDWLLGANGFDYLDNSLIAVYNFNPDQLINTSCQDSITVQFNIQDNCLKSAFCESKIYVIDETPPEIDCPTILSLNVTDTEAQSVIATWMSTVSGDDNCHSFNIENNLNMSDLCESDSVNYIIFTVTDVCAYSNSCQTAIEVNHAPPTLFCPTNLHLECGELSNLEIINNWLSTSIGRDNSDNDMVVLNDFDQQSLINACFESIPVEFTVSDICNNSKNCTAHIIIEDNTPPEISCPQELTIDASSANLHVEVNAWMESISILDCNQISVENNFDPLSLEFSCDSLKTIEITFEVNDLCSNSSSCNTELHIKNDVEASLTCPAPLSLNCGDSNQEMILNAWVNSALATDNLGNSFDIENNLQAQEDLLNTCDQTIAVEFEIRDTCNNLLQCYAVIQVADNMPPEIHCPQALELIMESPTLNMEIDNWLEQSSANDNCLLDTITNNLDLAEHLPTCEDTVDINVQFVAIDACNQQSECISQIRLISENIPTIHCELPLNLQCGDTSNDVLISQWLDNFGGQDYFGNDLEVINDFNMSEFEALSCDQSLDVHFQVTDACNESTSCISKILLGDEVPPQISCPNDITLNTTSTNNIEVLSEWVINYSAQDNCTNTELLSTFNFDTIDFCLASQPIEIELEVSDFCGNTNSCIARIFLNDALPYIECPSPLHLECADSINMDKINLWLLDGMAMDNAGELLDHSHNFILNQLPEGCDELIEVSFKATDRCGQSAVCKTQIFITDNIKPDIICPDPVELNINSPTIDLEILNWLDESNSNDKCSDPVINNDYGTDLDEISCALTVDVTFKSEDACNNQNQCVSQIEFVNLQPVHIQCPENISLICGDENIIDQINAFIAAYQVESNLMYMVYISPEIEYWNLNCEESYTQAISFEIEDECGNKNECNTYIDFLPSAKIYIPNAFSPNDDGQNDYFTVFSNESVTHIKIMSIYDRWGNLIFNKSDFPTNEEREGWSGISTSGGLVDGVYTYYIELSDIFNNNFMYSGTITLFK